MEWYVIHAYSGYENKVREALLERIERFSMEENFGEIMVPSEEVVELRGGQERRIQRKFFPGYVLVKMELNDSTWHLVKDTPRVMGFIGGSKDKPTPISEAEAKGIMQQLEHGAEIAKPKITFEPGEMVRVIDGQLKKNQKIRFMAAGATHTIDRVGIFSPKITEVETLGPGEIGFINSGIKSVSDCKVGDTITEEKNLILIFFLKF